MLIMPLDLRFGSTSSITRDELSQRVVPDSLQLNNTLDLKHYVFDNALILIGYQGGCVDGCEATYMSVSAISVCHPTAQVNVVPICHEKKYFSEQGLLELGMIVFCLDITPTLKYIEALRKTKTCHPA